MTNGDPQFFSEADQQASEPTEREEQMMKRIELLEEVLMAADRMRKQVGLGSLSAVVYDEVRSAVSAATNDHPPRCKVDYAGVLPSKKGAE